MLSVCGIGTGALVHIALAAFGLSAILASSFVAYAAVRYVGAAYLVYVGVSLIRSRSQMVPNEAGTTQSFSPRKVYHQGVLTNLFNPKVALFFLSFLPQFVSPTNSYGPLPFLILGFTFLFTGTLWCFFLAWFAAAVSHSVRQNRRVAMWMQRSCGALFIALGVKVALEK